ncbi:hypothetical protein [Bacillus wiedmannii]|nr:hypothetical protein [Bacillus wiedmannii]MED3614056.1 hypothetical protein [Bacillus wiedmannii]
MKDKIPYVEKEIEAELKKQNSKNKEQKENLKDNDDGFIQLTLL